MAQPREISITGFIEIDAAMLGVVRASRRLENDKFTRGELAARDALENAAKRLRDAINTVRREENRNG